MVDRATLDAIFKPQAIAVFGASDDATKLGYHVMKSLVEGGFPGRIFPVNPGRKQVWGLAAYPAVAEIPGRIDLAIIVVPAQRVPGVLTDCQAKHVPGAIIISAGFKEIEDVGGARLQSEIARLATSAGIAIIGPNTFGLVNVRAKLNASFTPEFSRLEPGGISLVSQSGGISHLIGFLSMQDHTGFSKVVGLGNRCNVEFADLVEYLAEDPQTRAIALYVEGLDTPRALIAAGERLRGKKPLVVYKAGRSQASDEASQFHTGSLAGSYEIYRGAFRQAGMLAVDSAQELLDTAHALATCPLPKGKGVAVLSGQAGLGLVASDACAHEGLLLSPFSSHTQKRINALLPPLSIRSNPVDLGPAWASPDAARGIIEAALEDRKVHSVILCMVYASVNENVARQAMAVIRPWSRKKPILTCFCAPPALWEEEIAALQESGAANFPTPDRAARVLGNMVRYTQLAHKKRTPHGRSRTSRQNQIDRAHPAR